jgi:hypothetical protein
MIDDDDAAEDYEKRVQTATVAADAFAIQLYQELDTQNGGFWWWKDHLDWKRRVLISDYLIASVQGVSASLMAACLAADEYRLNAVADGSALQEAFEGVRTSTAKPSIHDFAAAVPRDRAARRRGRMIAYSAEHCLFHLGQVLDRLAAVIVIVGGFGKEDVLGASWNWINDLAAELGRAEPESARKTKKARRKPLSGLITTELVQPPESEGREAQTNLVDVALAAADHGSQDWLRWTRDTRNAMAHRPPIRELNSVTSEGVARLLYRHPKWTDIQALAFAEPPADEPMAGVFLLKSTADVLDGLCDSMNSFVTAIMQAVSECWNARRTTPMLILQPATQWQSPKPLSPPSKFSGDGRDAVPVEGSVVLTHTNEGRRWQSARVFDSVKYQWRE